MRALRAALAGMSIRGKLLSAMLVLIAFSFTLANIGLIADHRRSARISLIDNLSILAEVVGDTSRAALVFQDRDTAQETLAALHSDEHIERAILFDKDGEIFATYPAGDRRPLPAALPSANSHRIEPDRVWLSRAVALENDRVGTLLLASDLRGWQQSLATFVRVSVVMFVGILLLVLALASRLERMISEPIRELARTVRRVSLRGEYGVRARKYGEDELGELVDGFNAMLDEIESRDDELSRARTKLEQHVAALESSNTELEQFAYVASHDLQEPLRGIAGCLQLLERRYTDSLDADGVQLIDFAVKGASRMKSLISDLLDYSRVNRGAETLHFVDCERLYDEVLDSLAVSIDEVGATVTRDPLPTLRGDGRQLPLVFQNLISNALKFHGDEPPQVHVSAERKGDEWVFSVRDNGIGIEERFRERIFEIFQRLHTTAEYDGTGIGLAITRKIVARHNGRIWVDSEPGVGTCFYVAIPVSEERAGG